MRAIFSRKFTCSKNHQTGQQKQRYLREIEICDSVERGLSHDYILKQSKMSQNNVEKLTDNQTVALIDAWKEEPCLNTVKTPNYHNKVKSDASECVLKTVMVLRPETAITD